jgi:hypothetical protein
MPIDKRFMNAKNNLKASELFDKRLIYKSFAYSEDDNPTLFVDLYPIRQFMVNENYLYGRIDDLFSPVVPRKERMLPLETGTSQHALDFVVLAFTNMKKKIEKEIAAGNIPTDTFFSRLEVVKSYEDANVSYNQWLNTIRDSFLDNMIKRNLNNKIDNFDTFLGIFREHLTKVTKDVYPVTFSSFMMGRKSNIRNTGLVVEIANKDFSEDEQKIDFINQDYFDYYVKLAEQYGFFIDYEAPWRLVANIVSKPMKRAISDLNGDYTTLGSFFQNYYQKIEGQDLIILKNLAFATYTNYIDTTPNFSDVTTINGVAKKRLITRQPITFKKMNEEYSDVFWMNYYIDIKNSEKSLNYDRNQIDNIKREASLTQKISTPVAIKYINDNFRDIPSIEGSFYSDLIKGQFSVDSQKKTGYNKFIQKVVRNYRRKTE